jgi:hypothetical protein
VSRRTDPATSLVVMLHGPECDLPAARRLPLVLRFARRPSTSSGSAASTP